jgi:hypothetical protein
MTIEQAIARIKSATHDISDEYSDDDCLSFLNGAMQQVSSLLIGAKWPALAKEMLVHEGDTLPTNYMKPCGTYPLRMTDGEVHITDGSESVRFRYFATPPTIEDVTGDMPYNHTAINDIIVRTAVMLALNQNEYDISQDTAIIQAIEQAVAAGMA